MKTNTNLLRPTFLIFLALKDKKKKPLKFFITVFQVFLLFTVAFQTFSLLIAFFHVTNFLSPDCFIVAFKAFFTNKRFLPYTHSQHFALQEVAPTCFQGFPESQQFCSFLHKQKFLKIIINKPIQQLFINAQIRK